MGFVRSGPWPGPASVGHVSRGAGFSLHRRSRGRAAVTGLLALGLMRRALAAGVIVSAVCSALSPFIVLRRMSFVGHGIAHAAFGGVALGVLLGVSPTVSGLVFSIGVALLIGVIARRG